MASCAFMAISETALHAIISALALRFVFINSSYKFGRFQFSVCYSETRHLLLTVLTVSYVKEYIYVV